MSHYNYCSPKCNALFVNCEYDYAARNLVGLSSSRRKDFSAIWFAYVAQISKFMSLTKSQKLLLNYSVIGVHHVISNKPRSYLKTDASHSTAQEEMKSPAQHVQRRPADAFTTNEHVKLARSVADSCTTRDQLKQAVENFDGCALKHTAMHTVFSDGNPSAKVMLIGEAPGANEDMRGIPFCGESGQLLDKVLGSIGLNRAENLYISNAIFWRPPGNRKPTPNELEICLPFVEKHVALINPELLIVAGSVALSSLFKISDPISRCRGKLLQYRNQYLQRPVPAIVIFHPSYLLRQPSAKKQAWQDMLFIKKQLA
jgi:DNA polymerase